MNEAYIIQWIQEHLMFSDIECKEYTYAARNNGSVILCPIIEDYPNGIMLVYHNNMDEFEIVI